MFATHLQNRLQSTTTNRLPPIPPPAASRRNPLTDAQNNNYQQPALRDKQLPVPPPIDKAQGRAGSPPLPRQNAKVPPPSPPRLIRDNAHGAHYRRLNFLGEGGFARVYEVCDENDLRLACKVVTKGSLKTKKAKTKLYAEIKIHRSLQHPNIVGFTECFEDESNVYMTLELCTNGSLMDMLRRRRRFTEPEARFFLIQLIGACHYMHTHQVIHRDLKLGNLFLDAEMNVKVGDFGLAALIENPGERKKTICGTPNYIAPEVLFDQANGHSFEVDTWSIGVILYTFVVGKPPFQTKDVKAIYERIRENQYEFPADRPVSLEARELVSEILTPDPAQRPTLHAILDSVFFTHGIIPAYIPTSARESAPNFSHISRPMSKVNFARLRKATLLDDESFMAHSISTQRSARSEHAENMASSQQSRAQQEREFAKAVLPGSPISALLKSARQPLLVAPQGVAREEPMLRKLQAARESRSPLSRHIVTAGQDGEDADELERAEEAARLKELQSQKARIVAQMVPAGEVRGTDDEIENTPPEDKRIQEKEKIKGKGKEREVEKVEKARLVIKHEQRDSASAGSSALSGFEAARQTLTVAFDALKQGKLFRKPSKDVDIVHEKVFIISWVDYCDKYGMAYALTDSTVGVYFNDSTSIVLSPDKSHLDFITSRKRGASFQRKSHTINDYPVELKNKVYLLKHFERYIMDKLWGDYSFTFEDLSRTRGMVFVSMYLRMKHVIVFRLSNGVLQFNFFVDHSKIILSAQGNAITYLDTSYGMTTCTLSELMHAALHPDKEDPAQVKFVNRLIEKLRYCKEVLQSIHEADSKREQSHAEARALSTGTLSSKSASSVVGAEARNALEAAREALEAGRVRAAYDAGTIRSKASRITVR